MLRNAPDVERKRAERALRRLETPFRHVVDLLPLGAYTCDAEGRITYFNASAARLWGREPRLHDMTERFCGSVKLLAADATVIPREHSSMARVLASGTSIGGEEVTIERPDGTRVTVLANAHPLADSSGGPPGAINVLIDISDRKHDREMAAETVALLRIAGRVARLGGWTIQLPSRALTWSDETCAIHDLPPGYQPTLDEGIDYYPVEHRAEVRRHVATCERDGTSYDFEVPKITATGRRIWVRSIGEAVRDADGHILRLQGAFQDISSRRQAEEALRESEAEFRTLAESMPQMVWMTRPDGWNTYLNQRWVDYTGLSLEDSYGHGWDKPFHSDDRQRAWDAWPQAIASGHYNVECRLRGADGGYRWMLVRGLPLGDAAGQTVKWIGTCTDIDDLKQAQESALRSEGVQRALAAELETERARLIAAQAVASIGSWETDLATLTVIWSAETHRIFETTPEQFLPTHAGFLQLIHPDDRARVDEAFVRSLEHCSSGVIEHRLLMPDGRIKFAEERWQVVCDEQGQPGRAIGTCQDITDRRQAQESIRQKDALIRIAGRLTHTGGWAIETPGDRVFWSDELFEILEFTPGSMPALADALALYPIPYREKIVAAILACQQDGTPFDLELEILTAKGARKWVRVSGEAERRSDGSISRLQGAFQDITERKHLEQQYLRAQRMESIGTLAGGIAHDLNNVLAPILLSIGLLQEDEDDPDRLETLAAIEASAKRGAAMVGRVLSFARGADGRREDVQVARVVRDLATIVRDSFPKNIAFEDHLSPDLWTLQADATQLHQVLLNLCVNARDAMPRGGRITVTARNIVINEAFAAQNIDARKGPYVTIAVEDTGSGISTDIINQIFDPFFTTKALGKGTGLGLATSLAIVTGHKGFVRAYSDPGTATRFELYLPAQTTPSQPSAPVVRAARPRGNGETVLVVDDEAGIREIVQRTLKAYGYLVLLASDGAEAVALYEQHQEKIAVVLTDMMMPLMDGPATIQELVRLNPRVRIIAASGLVTDTTAAGAAGARVMGFLPKPYTAETLLAAVRAALA